MQYLLYLQQFQTIVCCECEYGVTKNGLRLHFERHHKMIPLKERRELENYVQNFDVLEVKNVPTPSQEVGIIEGLKVHKGFVCTHKECNHLHTTLESMKKHCQKKHEWFESKGTGYILTNTNII